MEASKVSFTRHTRELLNARPMSRTARSKLRVQRVKEYIRELPFGECQKADLIAAAGYDTRVQQQYANGWAFIQRLIRTKVIQATEGSNPKNSYVKKWVVLGDVTVTKTAKQFNEDGDIPGIELKGVNSITVHDVNVEPENEVPTPGPVREPVLVDLIQSAKDFAWNTNSDSLREFVAWVQR